VADTGIQEAKAEVIDGRLVVSIGLDTLDELRKRMGVEDKRVSAADIADFIADKADDDNAAPFEIAIRMAVADAQTWDHMHEATTEPSTEFMR
jgi:hypothetical protein